MDSLDSLWFFTNVLSSPITQPSSTSNPEAPIGPITPISQTQVPDLLVDEILEEICPIYHDFVAKDGGDERDKEEEELAEEEKKIVKSRFEGLDQETKINVGWLEDVNEFYAFWVMGGRGTRIGSQNVGKMPALSDEIAMKEHLKSWAYAVACAAN